MSCIELLSSSARVTSVKSTKGVGVCDGHPDPKIGPQVYLGPIKSKITFKSELKKSFQGSMSWNSLKAQLDVCFYILACALVQGKIRCG